MHCIQHYLFTHIHSKVLNTIKNIIYQTEAGEGTEFEFEYIDKVLFSKVLHDNVFDGNSFLTLKNDSIIIYSEDSRVVNTIFLNYLENSQDFSLLHLSNESLDHKTDYYKKAGIVLRSYWNPFSNYKNTYAIPLGFKSGLLNRNKEALINCQRNYIWSFCGQIKSHRLEMKNVLQNIQPFLLHTTSGWSSEDQLSVERMASIYKNSIFVPCPFGNINPDSFRIMECLEYGCIPVCIKFKGIDYYKFVYGDHPFIIGNTWQDCLDAINYYLGNVELLIEKQAKVRDWYRSFIENLTDDIANLVAGSTANLKSVQFMYQKKAKSDIILQAQFYYHFNRRIRSLRDKFLTQ